MIHNVLNDATFGPSSKISLHYVEPGFVDGMLPSSALTLTQRRSTVLLAADGPEHTLRTGNSCKQDWWLDHAVTSFAPGPVLEKNVRP